MSGLRGFIARRGVRYRFVSSLIALSVVPVTFISLILLNVAIFGFKNAEMRFRTVGRGPPLPADGRCIRRRLHPCGRCFLPLVPIGWRALYRNGLMVYSLGVALSLVSAWALLLMIQAECESIVNGRPTIDGTHWAATQLGVEYMLALLGFWLVAAEAMWLAAGSRGPG
jgi:hypothetical protein